MLQMLGVLVVAKPVAPTLGAIIGVAILCKILRHDGDATLDFVNNPWVGSFKGKRVLFQEVLMKGALSQWCLGGG